MREKRIKMQSKPPFVVEILILRSPPWPFTPLFTSNFYYKARGVVDILDETPPRKCLARGALFLQRSRLTFHGS